MGNDLNMNGKLILECGFIETPLDSDLVLNLNGTGKVLIDGPLNGGNLRVGSITDCNSMSSKLNTDLSLTATGTGIIRLVDAVSVQGNLSAQSLSVGTGLNMVGNSITNCTSIQSLSGNSDLNFTATGSGVVRIAGTTTISGGLDMKSSAINACSTLDVRGRIACRSSLSPQIELRTILFRSIAPAASFSLTGTGIKYPVSGSGLGTRSFPLNFLIDGMIIKLHMGGRLNTNNNGTFTIGISLLNSGLQFAVASIPAIPYDTLTNGRFSVDTTLTIGGGQALVAFGDVVFRHGQTTATTYAYSVTNSGNVFTRSGTICELCYSWTPSVNNNDSNMVVQDYWIELL